MAPAFTLNAIANELEVRIRAHRPLVLPAPWHDEIIFPHFSGLSLLNVAHTVTGLLGVPAPVPSPLDDVVWGGYSPDGNIQRVIVFLTDGLGYLWLKQLMDADAEVGEMVAELTENRGPVPLTSIVPSTTAVALPTLWTGAAPAVHGMVGTRLFLRQLSLLGDLLKFRPVTGMHRGEIFGEWGMELDKFLPVPTMAERLQTAGIPTHLLLPKELLNTGLSRVMHRGVSHPHVHGGHSDFWLCLQDLLAQTCGQQCYVNIYWPAIDTLSHLHGAHNKYLHAEVKFQLSKLCDVLRDPAIHDGQTLVMIIADHGHHDAKQVIEIAKDERAALIYEALRGGTGGETRFSYLYLREGKKQEVIAAIEGYFSDCFTWIEPAMALEAGLFGPGIAFGETAHRLGDLIVVSRQDWQLGDPTRKFTAISRHGGLADWEMLIPLLWKRI